MNILIVEDETALAGAVEHILQKAGNTTDWVADGQTALDYIRGFSYDLVLLDIMLPKIDGYGVCEVIRKRSQVPIIMLTALSDEGNQLRGFEQQIDDYIPKPFSPKILLCKISAILRRSKHNDRNL